MQNLIPLEFKNQRIMTTKVLAEQFATEENNIKVNFQRNSARFEEGKHYFKLEGSVLADFKNRVTDSNLVGKNANSLILWTDRGAARHAKILETDEAWQIYEELEDTYFNVKENPFQGISKELQSILMLDKKYQQMDNRLEKLENTMTIDYSQQETLKQLVNVVAITALGGKKSNAYGLIGKKVFADVYRHLKNTFQVNSYRNIATVDFDKAIKAINDWKPCRDIELMIVGANSRAV